MTDSLNGGTPRTSEIPPLLAKGLTIIIRKESSAQVAVVVNPTDHTSIIPEGETKHPRLQVRFTKPNGST